jgi:transcriptional repressor NrdR
MRCPFCSENRDRVVDSRESRDGATIRRRRECVSCGRRFTSYEQIDDIPYMVVKHDGSREEFSRKKLLSGLLKACEKRAVATRSLEAIVGEAEAMLHDREDREITTREIGGFVMERLRELDQVAYVRFASVYRRFEDLDAFMDVLKTLIQPGSAAGKEPPAEPAASSLNAGGGETAPREEVGGRPAASAATGASAATSASAAAAGRGGRGRRG